MKVAYLVSRYPAVNHTYILKEVRGLRALGMRIKVASILPPDRASTGLSPEEREEAAVTFYVRPLGWLGISGEQLKFLLRHPAAFLRGAVLAVRLSRGNARAALRHLLSLAEAVVVGRWMLREGLRHCHTHFASTPALFLPTLFPITISATIHGPAEFDDPVGFLLPGKIQAALFIVAISDYGRSRLMRFSPYSQWNKLQVARLGVDPSEFTPVASCRAVHAGTIFEILFVGQLASAKGIHILVEACGALLSNGRKIRLRLIGEGPEQPSVEALIRHLGISASVILEGALGHHQVLPFYRSADIFALASFAEGIPVVLMEAMAMGIPCVATRITGIPELVEHGVNGLLVPPADSRAVAAAIQQLMDDQALRISIAHAAREKISRDYNAATNTARLYEIFLEQTGYLPEAMV